MKLLKPSRFAALAAICAATACGAEDDETQTAREPLVAACINQQADAPAGGWLCPDPRTLECGIDDNETIYVTPPASKNCSQVDPQVVAPMLAPGSHIVSVRDDKSGMEMCAQIVDVVDITPPVLTPTDHEAWPPNHKWLRFHPDDCATVADACDANVAMMFTYVSSDEPVNDTGDGNTEPDMRFEGCQTLDLRGERNAHMDGRVYRVGVRAVDDSGNESHTECRIMVPHDQSGSPAVEGPPVVTLQSPSCMK